MKITIFFIIAFSLSTYCSAGEPINNAEFQKGQVAGRLMKSALIIDTYYKLCFPSPLRTDSYFNGANKLTKEKWSFDLNDFLKTAKKDMGRDVRNETLIEVQRSIDSFGGCKNPYIKEFERLVFQQYRDKLEEFHAAK